MRFCSVATDNLYTWRFGPSECFIKVIISINLGLLLIWRSVFYVDTVFQYFPICMKTSWSWKSYLELDQIWSAIWQPPSRCVWSVIFQPTVIQYWPRVIQIITHIICYLPILPTSWPIVIESITHLLSTNHTNWVRWAPRHRRVKKKSKQLQQIFRVKLLWKPMLHLPKIYTRGTLQARRLV